MVSDRAQAHDYKLGPLAIDHPWIARDAEERDGRRRLSEDHQYRHDARPPHRRHAEVAKRFEIHEMSMDGGVMKMRELKDGLEIPPGATVELKPGSYHIMMMSLSRPLTKGEQVKGSLTFEKAGKVDIEFAVEAIGGNRRRAGSGERAQALMRVRCRALTSRSRAAARSRCRGKENTAPARRPASRRTE